MSSTERDLSLENKRKMTSGSEVNLERRAKKGQT